jgi:signal-transduction protein with cAMP-binding, CBS, and nucleotidyltransferase domain
VGAVVVTESDRPVGIITDRDLALAACVRGTSPDERVQSVMTCPVSTISKDEGVYSATQQMMEQAVRRLPVVDQSGSLVGLVSLDDLLLLLSRELQNMAEGSKSSQPLGNRQAATRVFASHRRCLLGGDGMENLTSFPLLRLRSRYAAT